MTAILSCRAMLNHGRLRQGCLIEFLYPTVSDPHGVIATGAIGQIGLALRAILSKTTQHGE